MDESGEWSDRVQTLNASSSSFLKKPCVRNSLMAGIATGTLMGIHKFRVGRTVPQACQATCFTFVLGSCIHMMACTFQLRRKYDRLANTMEMQGIPHAREAPASALGRDNRP